MEGDIGLRKSHKLSNTRVPENEFIIVYIKVISKADETVAGTHHTVYFAKASIMEREAKPSVFIEIFIVVPLQCVVFFLMLVSCSFEEEEGMVVVVRRLVEMHGNEGRVLDKGFPCFAD